MHINRVKILSSTGIPFDLRIYLLCRGRDAHWFPWVSWWVMKVPSWSCLIWNPRKYFNSPIIDILNFCIMILLNSSQVNLLVDPNCDRTSQVIRPTYSCPCPSDLGQPYRCTWSLDKFSIWILYLSQERFTRHTDITTHRRNEYAKAIIATYFILKYRKSIIIIDQWNIRVLE
jgi:hypothetical protein